MPEPSPTRRVTVDDIADFAQGFIDALIHHFSKRSGAWVGITIDHFASEVLTAAMQDSRRFLAAITKGRADREAKLLSGFDLYVLGGCFFAERSKFGIGFDDLLMDDEFRHRLIDAAIDFKPFAVEIGEDRIIRVAVPPLVHFPFEISVEDRELLELLQQVGFSISLSLDPNSGGVHIEKDGLWADWSFISEIDLSDGRTFGDAKSALKALRRSASSKAPSA